MGTLSKFFGSRDDVPEWAHFFAPGAYRGFLEAVSGDMKRRRARFELREGVLVVERQEYGLQNLAQLCHQCPGAEWPSIVAKHFDALFDIGKETAELDRLADDFDRVRRHLKVRLYPTDMQGLEFVVRREPAPGLVEVLVYDLPNTIATVHPDSVKKWGRERDELFALGMQNVRADGRLAAQVTALDGGARVVSLVGDSFFSASHALFLEDYIDPATAHGAIVGVPNRHTVLYHAIEDLSVVSAIQSVLVATFGMFHEGPGSVSPNLYWWRGRALTHLPSRVRANSIEFSPPDDFVATLDALPPAP